jgi:hypothetical protein
MKELLMVSHPTSGFGIHLPKEVEQYLGGEGKTVKVTTKELKDGRVRFTIVPDPNSDRYIRKNARGTFKTRVFWSGEGMEEPPVPYLFGKEWIMWNYLGKGEEGVTFVLPRKSELKPPATKTPGGKPVRERAFFKD